MIKLKKLLKESPDTIRGEDGGLLGKWQDDDARAFAFDEDGIFHVTQWGETHTDAPAQMGPTDYEGRLWKKHKIVSFWEYPDSPEHFRDIAKLLKRKTGVDILGKQWKIEVTMEEHGEHDFIPTRDY